MAWVWRTIVLLASGLFVTLLLAFACVLLSPLSLSRWGSRVNDAPWLAFSHERGFGRDLYRLSASHIVWPAKQDWAQMKRATLPRWVDPGEEFSRLAHLVCVGAGWPAIAFTARLENANAFPAGAAPTTPARGGKWQGAYILSRAGPAASISDRVVPLKIHARGLVINIVFWSGAIAGLLLTARVTRSRVRHWRGRCAACGYDLRGHLDHGLEARATGCPECGWLRKVSSTFAGEAGNDRARAASN